MWSELIARIVTAAGVTRDDVAQVSFGYGMFTGGFGLHYGLEKVGATVVPHSAGNTARQIQFMQDFGTTVLIATPSYALYIGEVRARAGRRPRVAQAAPRALRRRGVQRRDARARSRRVCPSRATDNYGLTEVIGPGVAGECECRAGQHVNEDHFIVECLDPASGEPVGEGEVGELVFTSLTKEALPVLRYRTRDLCTRQHRALRVRPHHGPAGQVPRPHRRHVHHQRRQRLPFDDRVVSSSRSRASSRTT